MSIKTEIKNKRAFIRSLVILFAVLWFAQFSHAQIRRPGSTYPTNSPTSPNAQAQSKGKDSLGFEHRDALADSITISFRYLDSLKSDNLDSSLGDFSRFYTVPANYVTLGNNGNAAFPVLFTPILKAGWDAGFHAFDVYEYNLEDTRFYKTTRPFTQLTYLIGSGKEQVVKAQHTQNIRPNWNAGLDYNLISSPGFFQTQNTNHNSYRFFSNYQGKKKRYAAYLTVFGNKINSSENGGIQNDSFLLDPARKKRFSVPVNLGGDAQRANPFSTTINTGNIYKTFTVFLRQSYDFGKRDSIIINDSTKDYLFYPKFRFQHNLNYSTYSYKFQDNVSGYETGTQRRNAELDSIIFKDWYDTTVFIDNNNNSSINFRLQDQWKIISNDFAIRQFPETKNPAQFIEAGIRVENISGKFLQSETFPQLIILPQYKVLYSFTNRNYFNTALHGEYRNKTRNKKWDALLKGEFYLTGLNAADYSAYATLTRFLNTKLGDVQVAFQNVSRTPSYIFNGSSSFDLDNNSTSKKENITVISATANNPRFTLMARNISIANYTYFKNYYQSDQFNGLVNITQVAASTKNKIVGHLNLYSDFIVQQTAGTNPVRVPLFYTRQRLTFEGIFFKNLNLSTGIDVSYNTPYKANNYSPVTGQFLPQDTVTISNLPQLAAYFNFRIKSFTGVVKVENLNAVDFANGFSFTNNSFALPSYPIPGFIFRIGVIWNFVN